MVVFFSLPWEDQSFDLAIDRAATCCVSFQQQIVALKEIHRALRSGGFLFFNGYSDEHTSALSGNKMLDGRIENMTQGSLVNVGPITFNSPQQIDILFQEDWKIKKIDHLTIKNTLLTSLDVHAEWRVIAQKI